MDEDLTPPPAAKRARTGDMPPVPVRARFPLPGVAPPEPVRSMLSCYHPCMHVCAVCNSMHTAHMMSSGKSALGIN